MNQTDVGVAVVGTNHTLIWVNDAFAELIGYSADDLIGQTFEQITHPDDVDLDRHLATRLFAGELDCYEMEKRYMHRDNFVVPVHLKVSMIRDRRRKVLYATAAVERIALPRTLSVKSSAPLTADEQQMDRIRRAMMD